METPQSDTSSQYAPSDDDAGIVAVPSARWRGPPRMTVLGWKPAQRSPPQPPPILPGDDSEQKLIDGSPTWDRPSLTPYEENEARATLAATANSSAPSAQLPKPRFSFNYENNITGCAPLSREKVLGAYGDTAQERRAYERIVEQHQRKSKARPGESAPWHWKQINFVPPTDDISTGAILRRVEFFPWGNVAALAALADVFAVAGGNKVTVYRLQTAGAGGWASVGKIEIKPAGQEKEDLRACAWALDLESTPAVPFVVVGGTGRLVHVIKLTFDVTQGRFKLKMALNRSISGPGGTVFDISTVSSQPEFVVAAGEDQEPALYNITAEGGSNANQERLFEERVREWNSEHPEEQLKPGGIHRLRVPGELVGKFAGSDVGHNQAILSCAVRPMFPFLATSGVDGRVCVWLLPDLKNWSDTARAVLLGEPIFRSHIVHAGQWIDQVAWASPTSIAIISKSSYAHADSAKSRSKMVLLWTPQVLDVEYEDDAHTPEQLGLASNVNNILPPQGELAYTLERRAEWEDENVVGDHFGVYHAYDAADTFDEDFVAVPIGPRPMLAGGSTSPSISIQHMFSARRFPCADASSSDYACEEERRKALFPDGRDRSVNENVPRWLPEDWIKLDKGGKRDGENAVRWRATGVSVDGNLIVAVGDSGAMGAWQRVKARDGVRDATAAVEILTLD